MWKESKLKIFRFSFALSMCICVRKWMDKIIKQTNLSLSPLSLSLSLCVVVTSAMMYTSVDTVVCIGLYFGHCLNRIVIAFLIATIRYNNMTILGDAYVLRATIGSPLWHGSLSLYLDGGGDGGNGGGGGGAATNVTQPKIPTAIYIGTGTGTHTHAIHVPNTPWDRLA